MFLLNCLKFIYTTFQTRDERLKVDGSKNVSYFMFNDNYKPVCNLSEMPIIIKESGITVEESISQLTFCFLIYSENKERENITGDIMKTMDSTDLEMGIKNFSSIPENHDIIKMGFRVTLDLNETKVPVKAKVIFPKNKNLFNLEVKLDPIINGNLNLTLKFTYDINDVSEFSESFKTDGKLYGIARIFQSDGKSNHFHMFSKKIQLGSTDNLKLTLSKNLLVCEEKLKNLKNRILKLKDRPINERIVELKHLTVLFNELEKRYNRGVCVDKSIGKRRQKNFRF